MNTCALLSGVAATYQSYHAWVMSSDPGRFAIRRRAAPVRRHRYAVLPVAPKAYATSGAVAARSTASRVHAPVGADGRVTAAKVPPRLVETNRPSTNDARISTAPPSGCTDTFQQR